MQSKASKADALPKRPAGKPGIKSESPHRPLTQIERGSAVPQRELSQAQTVEDARAGAALLLMGGQGEGASGYPGGRAVRNTPHNPDSSCRKPLGAATHMAGESSGVAAPGANTRKLRSGRGGEAAEGSVEADGNRGQGLDGPPVALSNRPGAVLDGPSKRTRTHGPVPSPGDLEAAGKLMDMSRSRVPQGCLDGLATAGLGSAKPEPVIPPKGRHSTGTGSKQGRGGKEKASASQLKTGPEGEVSLLPGAPGSAPASQAGKKAAGKRKHGDGVPGGSAVVAPAKPTGHSIATRAKRGAPQTVPETPAVLQLAAKTPVQPESAATLPSALPFKPPTGGAPASTHGGQLSTKRAKRGAPDVAPQAPPFPQPGVEVPVCPGKPALVPPEKPSGGVSKKASAAPAKTPVARLVPLQSPLLGSPSLAEAAIAAGRAAAIAASPQGAIGALHAAGAPSANHTPTTSGAGGQLRATRAAATTDVPKAINTKGKAAGPAKRNGQEAGLGDAAIKSESGQCYGKATGGKRPKEMADKSGAAKGRAVQKNAAGNGRGAGVAKGEAGQGSAEEADESGGDDGAWTAEQVEALQV
jgi:hypothetical protein